MVTGASPATTGVEIMSPERVRRTLVRLACEVVERNRGVERLVVLGIRDRGVMVAERLADEIRGISGQDVKVFGLDVRPFRDDVQRVAASDASSPVGVELDVTGYDVLLVDDVLFTGRTARAALDAVVRLGRPRSIQFVVLVDRGHREYPIQPDYVGRLIQTKHRERVEVATDGTFAVTINE
jgi:pyrimidine operon attenuation protein/uracil phosphoribosyltransferase